MTEVLFEVTKDNLETGMRGIPVGYCVTSSVDPEKGLFYMGRPMVELAALRPEQVIYLLFNQRDGSEAELQAFSKDLEKRAFCSPEVIEHIHKLPRRSHPMQLFSAALLIAAMYEEVGDYREDCLNVIAKIPIITATVINHHAGWGGNNPPNPSIGYIENFTQMLRAPDVDRDKLTEVMRLFNVLHYDHGGGNLSTFVGKAISSSLEGMYGCLSGAMNALAGPKHGRANQDCLKFLDESLKALGPNATNKDVEDYIRERLNSGNLIYGFGHAVLRVEDPRATIFYKYSEKNFPENPLVQLALKMRLQGTKVLSENPKISNPYPNVDAISGTALSAAGFPYPEYFTTLFGMSRCVGIARQIVYERCEARDGKGTPIVRPKYFFKAAAALQKGGA